MACVLITGHDRACVQVWTKMLIGMHVGEARARATSVWRVRIYPHIFKREGEGAPLRKGWVLVWPLNGGRVLYRIWPRTGCWSDPSAESAFSAADERLIRDAIRSCVGLGPGCAVSDGLTWGTWDGWSAGGVNLAETKYSWRYNEWDMHGEGRRGDAGEIPLA